MNELIKLGKTAIGGSDVQTVNARELHAFLESGQEFSAWIKGRIEKYDFVEGVDFTVDKFINGRATQIDYHISTDMAKELSMVERNDKGKEARQYFIECERRVKSIDPMQALNDPGMMRGLLLTYTEKVLQLEESVKTLGPKAAALDRIATFSEGSYCVRDAAKTLQVQEKKLKKILIERKWGYHRPMGTGLLAYAERLQQGLMEHKLVTGEKSDGSEWTKTQARITAKGMAVLAKILAEEEVAA